MKAYLIKSSAPGPFKEYKKAMGAPPQNIFSLAATTPEGVELALCDETIGMKPDLRTDADIVVLLFHTPDAVHAYDLADRYRAKGRTVVLGGLHPSFLPDEALEHCDAVMIGEVESIWEQLLADYEAGALKPTYKRDGLVDLSTVRPYPTDLIPPSRYKHLWSVLVSRGCGHRCEFCAVPPFFGGKYTLRPIENIVAEIKNLPKGCWVELHADNLTANRKYALELFTALKPLGVKWIGESTIKLADDEELLRAAADSGCTALLIGIETSSKAALADSGKGFVTPDSIREKIARFHEKGIHISTSIIFGFDSHTPEIFEESETFCRQIGIDEVQPVILIPFPGTPLHARLESEDRILTKDWSKYDGDHAVFQPTHMTPKELEDGSTSFWYEIQKKKRVDSPHNAPSNQPRTTHAPALTTGSFWPVRWRSIIALIAIAIGLAFNWYWIWGVLFIVWALNDLILRRTYLMDEIPRDDTPLLYWIVVLMWLLSGIWTLTYSDVSPWGNSADAPPLPTIQQSLTDKAAPGAVVTAGMTLAKLEDVDRVFHNDRYGFGIRVPESWSGNETTDAESVTLHFEDQAGLGTVIVMGCDLPAGTSVDELITFTEPLLAQNMTPADERSSSMGDTHRLPDPAGLTLTYRAYSGAHQGYDMQAVIGYAVCDERGFALMGVYDPSDDRTRTTVYDAMRSFTLSAGAK